MTSESTFDTPVTAPPEAPLNPARRVNYTRGMVLGVDDFDQEYAYLIGRDQWMARDLIGYGTAVGLRVTKSTADDKPRIIVSAGTAVSPQGQMIRVSDDQCAYLDDWLLSQATQAVIIEKFSNPPVSTGIVSVYVVLCYSECYTEKLPSTGEPCRSDDNAVVATRVQDDFKLELRFTTPIQTEEDALRDFVAWLAAIPITDAQPATDLTAFVQAIRDAVYKHPEGSTPFDPANPPDFMVAPPPASLIIPVATASEYLRTAFRIWTTELRPNWRGITEGGQLPNEECILLAEVKLPVMASAGRWILDRASTIEINEDRRPFLLHLRFLQEWLQIGDSDVDSLALAVDLSGTTDNARVIGLHNIPIVLGADLDALPDDGQVLSYKKGAGGEDRGQWIPVTLAGGGGPAGPLPLAIDLSGSTNNARVVALHNIPIVLGPNPADLPAAGQVLSYQPGTGGADRGQWVPVTPAAGGAAGPLPLATDLSGTTDNATVEALRNIPIVLGARRNSLPQEGQVLSYVPGAGRADRGTWVARTIVEGGAASLVGDIDMGGTPNNATVIGLRRISIDPNVNADQPPATGDVLTYDAGQKFWTARKSPDVTHTAQQYSIVAAGLIRVDPGSSSQPVYNNLRIDGVFEGGVFVNFDGYTPPDGSFMYIVKALPVTSPNRDITQPIIVQFDGFRDEGFVLQLPGVDQDGKLIWTEEQINAANLGFMIEVSRYETKFEG